MFNSIRHYELDVTRAALTGGEALNPYLRGLNVDLFLSCSSNDVQAAIDEGIAAAVLYKPPVQPIPDAVQLRIAFDADAVLFSEASEALYREHGLESFLEHERKNADSPLAEGPLAKLLKKLSVLQEGLDPEKSPLRLAIVTARNSPAHERVIKTLRAWNVRVDAAFFLGGVSKDRVLEAFGAHIFFDDQEAHLASASITTPSALVPYRSDSILRVEAPVAEVVGSEA
jgi:5'-nucleotidase